MLRELMERIGLGSRKFYVVDVFAERKYAGNQLAVVTDAGDITGREMQLIAREMNYSETAFILSGDPRNGGYDVRIFTQVEEVPFAGHPTLGTAYVIQQEIIKELIEILYLNLKIGKIPVRFKYKESQPEILWMNQNQPEFGHMFDPVLISESLNLGPRDIDERYPIQEVSTGLPFIIVPLKKLEALKNSKVKRDIFFQVIRDTRAKAVLLFCPETYSLENDLNVRVYVDYYGIPEDPATGSGNGCLAAYLAKYRYFGDDHVDIRVEQGCEIGRPSLLYLRAISNGTTIDVDVGGKVMMVAKGELC
ncbi:MAG: PhzF family phenazine biosynthesis protein [ANME-2 cluster archaeon]|nr:PhzF family phenazine biosynthesis protein [ANME-2 cluster archaeon]